LRSFAARHSGLRYAQIVPVGLLLWGTDAVDRLRAGAALAGLRNAIVVAVISRQLGGAVAESMNDWLNVHPVPGLAAAWFYVAMQSTVTAAVGLLLIWRRAPTFSLHRNALIACNLIGLVVFWLYPVAPPRMLPGYHDVTAAAIPLFSGVLESKAADQFASLPSLHVAWSLWVAVACGALARRPVLRAAAWLYPVATAVDVLATANHYLLDVITAPGVVLLAYAIALLPGFARRLGLAHGGALRRRDGPGGSSASHGWGTASEQDDPRGHDGERRHLGDHVPRPACEALVEPESADADRYQRCGGGDHGEHRRDQGF
jgi:PAP2 superfamily